jgi:RNA polymerase sigma-70 factor (ECF subfamily)
VTTTNPDTDHLVAQASRGDDRARQELLERHRHRLRRMVACHLDRRLAARVDPSDVVQEALADAARKLDDYLRERPLPFYPWLRRLAWERLVKLHRRHLRAQGHSVRRETPGVLALPDESAMELAQRLVSSGTGPVSGLVRQELRQRVQSALARLGERDREVLVLRYLEGMTTREVAATLGVSEGAVKMRQLRALDELRRLLTGAAGEGSA